MGMVVTKSTPADNDIALVSAGGRWNPKIKAYLVAAHSHCLGIEPEAIVQLYQNRNAGLNQEEFIDPCNMVINKFPLTFQSFIMSSKRREAHRTNKKQFLDGYTEFTHYLYNRLYYNYYSAKIMGNSHFGLTKEHPLSKREDDASKIYYFEYKEELKLTKLTNPKVALMELSHMKSTLLAMNTILQQSVHLIDSITEVLKEDV